MLFASCGFGSGSAAAQEGRYKEACANRPAVDGDTLYFCGTLDDRFVKFLAANTSPETRTLVVTSYGGHVLSTIDALETVESKGLKIVAEGVCASACAQFLLIPATKGEVLPGAILALHTTSTSMRAMRLHEDWKDYDRLRPLMDAAARGRKGILHKAWAGSAAAAGAGAGNAARLHFRSYRLDKTAVAQGGLFRAVSVVGSQKGRT
jgi:hypothetical protein